MSSAACSLIGYPDRDASVDVVALDGGGGSDAASSGLDAASAKLGDAASTTTSADAGATPQPDSDGAVDGSAPLDAGADDAGAQDPLDAGALDAASADPIVFPSDDAGSGTLVDDASAPNDAGAGPDAGVTPCGGARALGLCWYLGAFGASCDTTCAGHGGFDSRAIAYVGTSSQGGSLADCRQILAAIGGLPAPARAYRIDGWALACHMWYTGATYWLDDPSAYFRSSSFGPYARLACGCLK